MIEQVAPTSRRVATALQSADSIWYFVGVPMKCLSAAAASPCVVASFTCPEWLPMFSLNGHQRCLSFDGVFGLNACCLSSGPHCEIFCLRKGCHFDREF